MPPETKRQMKRQLTVVYSISAVVALILIFEPPYLTQILSDAFYCFAVVGVAVLLFQWCRKTFGPADPPLYVQYAQAVDIHAPYKPSAVSASAPQSIVAGILAIAFTPLATPLISHWFESRHEAVLIVALGIVYAIGYWLTTFWMRATDL